MLTEHPPRDASQTGKPAWIDLCNPDKAEFAKTEADTGLHLPSRETLSEIESTSRLRERDGTLAISIPMFTHGEDGVLQPAPVGFVLNCDVLVTLRYDRLSSFDVVAQDFGQAHPPMQPLTIFAAICEDIVDRLADKLEQAAAELRTLSADTFHVPQHGSKEAIRSNQEIRAKLRQVGRLADGVAETRDVLLGVGRAVGFVAERTRDWGGQTQEFRLGSIQRDVSSLAEYEVHLSDKVQFLLDAMVGLIGIAQNDVFKILTIVSIAGIPPTLLAGIYGMNFKNMPELTWTYGYPTASP